MGAENQAKQGGQAASPLPHGHPAGIGLLRNERGILLTMVMLVMLVLSMLSLILFDSLGVDTKLAGHNLRGSQALNAAEAGVSEAITRIIRGDIPDTLNPRLVAQIFLIAPGSEPPMGPDSIALATAQPAGHWLRYSMPGKGPDVLTVRYKTDPGRNVIYRYDPAADPAVQTTSGLPIYVIESTGRRGGDKRSIVTEVTPKPIDLNLQAALTSDVDVRFSGISAVCGYNHRHDTLPGIGALGRSDPLPTGCNWQPGTLWELGSGHVLGVRTTGSIDSVGLVLQAVQAGAPSAALESQVGFYVGPWQALGMGQSQFYDWVGPPAAMEPLLPEGITYLDNNGTRQDKSGNFTFNAGVGKGLMYVDGDLTITGAFVYEGLIYVEGDFKVTGVAWVLGAVVVKGKTHVKAATGTLTILFSRDAVTKNLTWQSGDFVTLAWREVP